MTLSYKRLFFSIGGIYMNKNKVWILVGILVGIMMLIIFFLKFHYNFEKIGNTMTSKSEEEIIDSILNMHSYQATLSIEVETNKNKNQYVVRQSFSKDKEAEQEIIEPSNVAGIVTKYKDGELKLTNPRLSLEKVYENYSYVVDNCLWLDAFIADYQKYNTHTSNVQDDQIILEVKDEDSNKYNVYKKLYIDKKTGKPTKMIVQDINQKTVVYILYTEIEIS